MTSLHQELINRFGEHRVAELPILEGEIPLLVLELESSSSVTLIMTNGLSDYSMPVPEKYKGRENNELYFCLPSYWDWQALENPSMNWIYPWIRKMAKHVVDKATWFGHGHTFPNGKELSSISATMKQDHFILLDPILLSNELCPLECGAKSIHFLAIVPIFKDEMDYKQARGTFKLLQKLNSAGVTELLDDYRSSVFKSKWTFWRK
jgi:hypothetical protein